jgi:hypothetical protein
MAVFYSIAVCPAAWWWVARTRSTCNFYPFRGALLPKAFQKFDDTPVLVTLLVLVSDSFQGGFHLVAACPPQHLHHLVRIPGQSSVSQTARFAPTHLLAVRARKAAQ